MILKTSKIVCIYALFFSGTNGQAFSAADKLIKQLYSADSKTRIKAANGLAALRDGPPNPFTNECHLMSDETDDHENTAEARVHKNKYCKWGNHALFHIINLLGQDAKQTNDYRHKKFSSRKNRVNYSAGQLGDIVFGTPHRGFALFTYDKFLKEDESNLRTPRLRELALQNYIAALSVPQDLPLEKMRMYDHVMTENDIYSWHHFSTAPRTSIFNVKVQSLILIEKNTKKRNFLVLDPNSDATSSGENFQLHFIKSGEALGILKSAGGCCGSESTSYILMRLAPVMEQLCSITYPADDELRSKKIIADTLTYFQISDGKCQINQALSGKNVKIKIGSGLPVIDFKLTPLPN